MKILFLDIDGVLNSTRSVLASVFHLGAPRTERQQAAIEKINARWAKNGVMPYGLKYSIATVDPVAVGLVNRLLGRDENLSLVLSSAHRAFFCGSAYDGIKFDSAEHFEWLKIYLDALGLEGDRLCGMTPRLFQERGREVQDWLGCAENETGLEITHHCALDDGTDFEPFYSNLVVVNPTSGFSAENFYEATRLLVINEAQIIF